LRSYVYVTTIIQHALLDGAVLEYMRPANKATSRGNKFYRFSSTHVDLHFLKLWINFAVCF